MSELDRTTSTGKPTCEDDEELRQGSNSSIREVGINPQHWYAVAQSSEVKGEPVGVVVWDQPVCLFRDGQGRVQAIEDRCPHRLVRISYGRVVDESVECPYHGWRFGADGRCVDIPGMESQSMPEACHVKAYPVCEQHGFVWVFPGLPELAWTMQPMPMLEWDDLDFIGSTAPLSCAAHFSFVVENLMDMYHGHLHEQYQTWAVHALEEVTRGVGSVEARYAATGYYKIDRVWSALQLWIPGLRKSYPVSLVVTYQYPHWKAQLGEEFTLYGVFCPVGPRRTQGYLVHYTSLHHLRSLKWAPRVVRRKVKHCLEDIAKGLLQKLISQDLPMVEEEQRAYDASPQRKPLEFNRTLHAVQHLIRREGMRLPAQAGRRP